MAAWRVARSLDVLLAQLNGIAPRRSKASDGSIGDAAHASRESDHNPYIKLAGVGIVRARDFTHDPAGGLDCNDLAQWLVDSGDPRIRYIIWNRRIYTPGRGWVAYKGSNPHDKHLHLSVSEQPGWFDSTLPWSLPRSTGSPITTLPVQEDDMTPAESKLLTDTKNAVDLLIAVAGRPLEAEERLNARIQETKAAVDLLIGVAGRPLEAEVRMTAKIEALAEAMQQLATKQGTPIDMDAIEARVEKGVADAISSIQTTVSVKPAA